MMGDFAANGGPERHISSYLVGAGYFSTMAIPLLSGREFRWQDTDETGQKAILNQSAVSLLFPAGHAIGQRVTLNNKKVLEVVGVVADTKAHGLRNLPPPIVYRPITQDMMPRVSYAMLIRSNQNPGPIISEARSILRRFAPEVPTPGAMSMEAEIAQSLATERLMAMLASFFAISALLIMAVGLYGTLSYSTARRTGEIGVRMALGAQPGNIIGLILSENSVVVVGGCVLGLLLSLGCTQFVASFLFGIKPTSPMVLGISAGVLILAGLLASLPPALRATRIDPIQAIRHE
jgi:hypothetical protein